MEPMVNRVIRFTELRKQDLYKFRDFGISFRNMGSW